MTSQDFIFALENAVIKDDRWAIRQLELSNLESKIRREACRHADNLVLSEKHGSKEVADFSRAHLLAVVQRIRSDLTIEKKP